MTVIPDMAETPAMMIEKTPSVFRHELKHLVTPAEDAGTGIQAWQAVTP